MCIYGVMQRGNKARLSPMLFTHQWKKTLLYYRFPPSPLFVQEEEKHPVLVALRRGSPVKQVSLPPGELAQEGWHPSELHCKPHLPKRKLERLGFLCVCRHREGISEHESG